MGSLSVVYGITAAVSLLILGGYLLLVRPREWWFALLFTAVTVVNSGYLALSLSETLGGAVTGNHLAYGGSVVLPPAMLFILLKVTKRRFPRWLPPVLLAVAAAVFLVTMSRGYYREVDLVFVDGTAVLQKVYGPLHLVYPLYLFAYFTTMVVLVLRVAVKKVMSTAAHAVVLTLAVFINLAVWGAEQLMDNSFEFLSVSYIISELFLLGLHLVLAENRRLTAPVGQDAPPQKRVPLPSPEQVDDPCLRLFLEGVGRLTPTEKAIFEAHLARMTTEEILSTLCIAENTLKFHNRNLYGKLGVSSRKELYAVYKQLTAPSLEE